MTQDGLYLRRFRKTQGGGALGRRISDSNKNGIRKLDDIQKIIEEANRSAHHPRSSFCSVLLLGDWLIHYYYYYCFKCKNKDHR